MVNTETHRRKYKNVERDPNVTLTIRDEENPYRYAKVRGEVVEKVTGQEARNQIDELSRKYHGEDYPLDAIVVTPYVYASVTRDRFHPRYRRYIRP